ncbi:MAG: hypothetical protein HY748_12705 [Elusimicrobia bacterium]|nr:hypothetical protein [Elusimicrobiota bacterium]
MPYECKVRSIEFLERRGSSDGACDKGSAVIRVQLEDGKRSVFTVATMDEPSRWVDENKGGFRLGPPVLFVRSLAEESVAGAVAAMAADMGGFWLRYYNSEKRPAAAPAPQAQAPSTTKKKAA